MLFRDWVFHKLNSKHHSSASHVSDSWCFLLNFLKLFYEELSHFLSIFWQFFVFEDFKNFQAKPALKWSSTISIEEIMSESRHYFSASSHCSQWISIGHSLRCNYNIWLYTMMFEAPNIFANSTKAGLNLVSND